MSGDLGGQYNADDTVYAPGYTDEKFLMLKGGMTIDEVDHIIPRPESFLQIFRIPGCDKPVRFFYKNRIIHT